MTLFLLIRHGMTDAVGEVMYGRLPGWHLNDLGRRQAEAMARQLDAVVPGHLFASPMERTRETAEYVSRRFDLPITINAEIIEIDSGDWTGRTFAQLDADPLWHRYNRFRSITRIPGGEIVSEVQARMVREMDRLYRLYPDAVVALFSHGDPIRSALAAYAGVPLDHLHQLDVRPASVSVVFVDESGGRVLCINHTDTIPAGPR